MERELRVELGDRSYSIFIENGGLDRTGTRCAELFSTRQALLVTDSQVEALYADRVEKNLLDAGISVTRFVIPSGEASKSEEWLFKGYDVALDAGLDRHAFVVALGGGVVGDLAGYLAASYLRGLPFIQIPTTLLAMVDSSVGGKTGINLPKGKNLIGAFHQPAAVLVDIDTLSTLEPRERNAGMAEVIKYGVIRDADLFDYIESHTDEVRALDNEVISHLVAESCQIKADVVAADEREGGLRAILNFGHTLGHAVEQAAGYGHYLHGEAISIGMHAAALISQRVTGLPQGDVERLVSLLQAFDLPIRAKGLHWDDLVSAMARDKKSVGKVPRFVLATGIGAVDFGCEVDEAVVKEVWHGCSE